MALNNGLLLVDDADMEFVRRYGWTVNSGGYAHATIAGKTVSLHRMLLGLEPGDSRQVDHINGDRLDNRRNNLRVCTARENRRNAQRRKDNTSGYKGVIRVRNEWRAVLAVGGFKSAEEASHVYDVMAEVVYGQYAKLNFPHSGEPQGSK